MEISEAFGKVVNLAQTKGIVKSLEFLNLSSKKIESLVKRRKYLMEGKNFDIVIDKKDKYNQLNIYLTNKKWSKKLLRSLKKSSDFKSMVIFLGNIPVSNKVYELRLGAFGISSSNLVRSIIKK